MKFVQVTETKVDIKSIDLITSSVFVNMELVYKISPLSYQHSASRLFFVGGDDVHIDVRETPEEIFAALEKGDHRHSD